MSSPKTKVCACAKESSINQFIITGTNPSEKMAADDERRRKALEDYRKKLIEHREFDTKLKKSESVVGKWYSWRYCCSVGSERGP